MYSLSSRVALMLAVAGLGLAGLGRVAAAQDGQNRVAPAAPARSADRAGVDQVIATWPERPRLGANMMIAKYGVPAEATPEKLVWHNQGPFKRIMVTRTEYHHDFPKPHMDFLEHTVDYRVPAEKATELLAYDGSVTINRTAGEMSARCDLEGHNILTLNLAHDIITGKTDAAGARKAFGENVVLDSLGKHPPYVEALQFKPPAAEAAVAPDQPVIPGSPVRPAKDAGAGSGASAGAAGDGEALGFVVAVDDNEILAASEAAKKKVGPEVMAYAKMLHAEHGRHLVETMRLGQAIGVTPLEMPAVDKLRVKAAGALAALLPLDGAEFERAYLDAMVKDHTEVLAMIDTQLLNTARNDALKKHLTETRGHIASHLEKAKSLQGGANR
jgi:predicted outer membrane protein